MTHSNIISPFIPVLKQKIAEIRSILAQCESLPSFRLDIEIEGRTHDGDIKVMFKLGEGSYSNMTEGGDLDAVVKEFARRFQWKELHAPLCLTYVPQISVEEPANVGDEILF